MSNAKLAWAYEAVINFAHLHKAAALTAPRPTCTTINRLALPATTLNEEPNFLLLPTKGSSRQVLMLARRPEGRFVGIKLSDTRQKLSATSNPKSTSGARKVLADLSRRGFCKMGHERLSVAKSLLVHTNHLVGCELNGQPSQVYAHTLDELASVSATDRATLQPAWCVVGSPLCEWDNWHEILGEPDCEMYCGSGSLVDSILSGAMQSDAVAEYAQEVIF